MSKETKSQKIYFEPSTVESIDRALYEYVENLKLSVRTNEGAKVVPVLWGTSERSFLAKNKKESRDNQGALKFPVISVRRTSFTKPMPSAGIFQGTIPENQDEQGGSLEISRAINQEKTSGFASTDSQRLTGQANYPRPNPKVVYKTISAPMPVNVTMMYEVVLRTEYQQQMNDLILPFATLPGTINHIPLRYKDHKYEGFIQGEYQTSDNLSDFSTDERKFETKISIKVIGYLVGQENNREKPHFSIRENFVEVKIPKESVITDPKELEKYGL